MDFAPDPLHADIRQAVRQMCADFDDDYWMLHEQSAEFPWEFYDAIVAGGLARVDGSH